MKRARSVKTRGGRREGAGVSLFPFLAVLMCTMGALIVLLVVITRQARLQAAEAARAVQPESDQTKEDLVAAKELVELQISQLSASRQRTEAQMAEVRLKLGHIEDHARRLREELARLQAAWAELDKVKSEDGRRRAEVEADLERLEAAAAEAQSLLADAQEEAKNRRKSYAVVPYEGPNQTRRRPIYLECRSDAIVLQPEGIRFSATDFDGPLGPGNPLDVALRAAREYWLSREAIDPESSGEPYPLLLVRPDGIEAYYAARAAMKSWASDFGYELIDQDWELEFQRPDEGLANLVRGAVDSARVRQQRLAAAAPSQYGGSSGSSRPVYRAAPMYGGVMVDESTRPADSGYRLQRPAGAFGSRFGSPGGETEAAGHERAVAAQKTSGQTETEGAVPRRPGEWLPRQAGSSSGGKDAMAADTESKPDKSQSLAETRGRDWALPDAAQGSVPITRPIRVDLHPDRLMLVPERGLRGEKQVEFGGDTTAAVDEFVSAVWGHMETWGIAGRGMYWRPILKIHVAPGAEQRYEDLKILMEGSGIEVSRSEGP
ncbi:MAG: hypothetical protein HUU20_26035 [Pirellulales bacterium]|nr:hypothetical protein [Pirellulales bacterium]